MDSRFLVILLIIPFLEARRTLNGYTLYDPAKYECKVVHGGYTEWSCFGPCSVSCGKGYQKRYRHCAAPIPKYGGNKCTGDHIEARECDTKIKCPVHGGWSDYVKGECTKTCGGGVRTFTRYCNDPKPAHCGNDCDGASTRTEKCNTHICPTWTDFTCTDCQKRHGKCVKKCTRTCLYYLKDRKYCEGPDHEYRTCSASECKPDVEPRGKCGQCHAEALLKASGPKYSSDFVGLACPAPELADFCKTADLSKNGGFPANDWFWIHCSPDGPFCKPCATRGLVFNKKCDACEATRDGPCTGATTNTKQTGDDSILSDEDLW